MSAAFSLPASAVSLSLLLLLLWLLLVVTAAARGMVTITLVGLHAVQTLVAVVMGIRCVAGEVSAAQPQRVSIKVLVWVSVVMPVAQTSV
jgi:hypothetical protein